MKQNLKSNHPSHCHLLVVSPPRRRTPAPTMEAQLLSILQEIRSAQNVQADKIDDLSRRLHRLESRPSSSLPPSTTSDEHSRKVALCILELGQRLDKIEASATSSSSSNVEKEPKEASPQHLNMEIVEIIKKEEERREAALQERLNGVELWCDDAFQKMREALLGVQSKRQNADRKMQEGLTHLVAEMRVELKNVKDRVESLSTMPSTSQAALSSNVSKVAPSVSQSLNQSEIESMKQVVASVQASLSSVTSAMQGLEQRVMTEIVKVKTDSIGIKKDLISHLNNTNNSVQTRDLDKPATTNDSINNIKNSVGKSNPKPPDAGDVEDASVTAASRLKFENETKLLLTRMDRCENKISNCQKLTEDFMTEIANDVELLKDMSKRAPEILCGLQACRVAVKDADVLIKSIDVRLSARLTEIEALLRKVIVGVNDNADHIKITNTRVDELDVVTKTILNEANEIMHSVRKSVSTSINDLRTELLRAMKNIEENESMWSRKMASYIPELERMRYVSSELDAIGVQLSRTSAVDTLNYHASLLTSVGSPNATSQNEPKASTSTVSTSV